MAAVDAAGFPTRPATNELVEAAWGASVRDRLIVKAGIGSWQDGSALGAAIVDLFTVTIPAQTMATTLYVSSAWSARSQGAGGGTATADLYFLGPGAPAPTIGPWKLDADGTSWSGLSMNWAVNLAASANPSFKLRFTGAGGPGLYRAIAQASYMLVVA